MNRLLPLLVVSLAFSAPASWSAGVSLIPKGSIWKYLDDGSNQGSAWRAVGFDDSSWSEGPAQLGYGDDDEATEVSYVDSDPGSSGTQKNATTYFRTTFNVAEPSALIGLDLELTYDDGGVVYINGIEVARTDNLPSNPAYNEYASSSSSDDATQTWNLPSTVLVAGTNTIAVEIHQRSSSSSDISFDLELTGADSASLNRGPYLQLGTPTSMVVRWRTNVPSDSRVIYGTSVAALTQSATEPTPKTEHEITLSGLTPNTLYYYAVGTSAEIEAGGDGSAFFVTAPTHGTEKPMRIWVLGDSGTANDNQRAVRDRYYEFTGAKHTDLWLMLGDNAYSTGTDSEYQSAVFDIYDAMLRKSVVWPTLGNHDAASTASNGQNPYFNLFTLPTNAEAGGQPSGTEYYYSFDYGNIHFICLDSQRSDRETTGAMYQWLENDLEQTSQRWVIAYWHHPPYSKGSHDSDDSSHLVEMRENFLPLLEAHGVDLVMGGHSHSYERSKFIDGFYATPTLADSGTVKDAGNGDPDGDGAYSKEVGPNNGAVYVVAGSSGKSSRSVGSHPVMISSLAVLGSMILDINGNTLDATFLDDEGQVRDSFRIIKGPDGTPTILLTTTPDAEEWGTVPGSFTITRSGATNDALSIDLEVSGTAAEASDYVAISPSAVIPATESSVTIPVQPVADNIVEGPETVHLSVTGSGTYQLGSASSGTVTITDRPMDQWRFVHFTAAELAQENISGVLADPEADGWTNIEEYLFRTDPNQVDTPVLATSTDSGGLTLTYRRSSTAVDVTATPEVSSDPAGLWDSGTSFVEELTPVDLGNGEETVTVRDKTTEQPHRFMRLRLERPAILQDE